jgi:predicted transcriptional regulator
MLGKVDLAAVLLELVMNETSVQSLHERSGLSSRSIATQIKMLKTKKLVDTLNAGRTVKITERGIQFLDLYKTSRYVQGTLLFRPSASQARKNRGSFDIA